MEINWDFSNSKKELAIADRLLNISEAVRSSSRIDKHAKAVKQATTEVARLCRNGFNMDFFGNTL